MVVAYPLLAVAYITDRFGAFVEPIFFACFSVIVLAELVEGVRAAHVMDLPGPSTALARQVPKLLQRVSDG